MYQTIAENHHSGNFGGSKIEPHVDTSMNKSTYSSPERYLESTPSPKRFYESTQEKSFAMHTPNFNNERI